MGLHLTIPSFSRVLPLRGISPLSEGALCANGFKGYEKQHHTGKLQRKAVVDG